MTNNAINAALRRMGYTSDEMAGHGFRAMARTILDEVLQVRPDFIEHQLEHAVKDPDANPRPSPFYSKQTQNSTQYRSVNKINTKTPIAISSRFHIKKRHLSHAQVPSYVSFRYKKSLSSPSVPHPSHRAAATTLQPRSLSSPLPTYPEKS